MVYNFSDKKSASVVGKSILRSGIKSAPSPQLADQLLKPLIKNC